MIPRFGAVQISANLHNVLSAIAEVRVVEAESVAMEYGADSLFQHRTPMVRVDGVFAQLPVLGLEANTKYFMRARARSPGGQYNISTTQSFTTSPLPNDFTPFSVLTNKLPANGLVMLSFIASGVSAKSYAQVITNDGRVAWYREFFQPLVDFQKQPNGYYTAYTSLDASSARFFEFDQTGHIIREFAVSGGRATGPHELRLFDDRLLPVRGRVPHAGSHFTGRPVECFRARPCDRISS